MSVDILMATYNGSKYLRNQILSLQQQTYSDWRLLVCDDGSTDDTREIVDAFSSQDPRIVVIEKDSKEKLGAAKNFLMLTRYASAKYVIFCDQDDLWFEKKIELLVEYAERNFEIDLPALVYCDGYGYSDSKGLIVCDSISKVHASSLREFLFLNAGYQGCSCLFNRSLCEMAAGYQSDAYYMHDDVVSLLAHCFGNVHFLPKNLMLYRQHSENVTGNIRLGLLQNIRRVFLDRYPVLSNPHYFEKVDFFRCYEHQMSDKNRALFRAYIAFPKLNLVKRLLLLVKHGFSLGGSSLRLFLKALFRTPLG